MTYPARLKFPQHVPVVLSYNSIWKASQCLGRSSLIEWGFSEERSNVIVLNTKAIVKSSQRKSLFRVTARLPVHIPVNV